MTLVGFQATNPPQQQADPCVDDRALPAADFAHLLDRRFLFTVDAAASRENAKMPRYWSREEDGLTQPWAMERVYCNPPYSTIRPWVEKAWREERAELAVLLLPANRTEQGWWQDLVEPFRDRAGSPLQTEFWAGRTRFLKPGQRVVGANERPPFGLVLCIWDFELAEDGFTGPELDPVQGVLG